MYKVHIVQGQNVTVDVTIESKCHCGCSELGRIVQASLFFRLQGSAQRSAINISCAVESW
jgi:hypothetical protein